MSQLQILRELRTFLVVWAGQFALQVCGALAGFGLAVWVYQQTGSVTQLAFVLVLDLVPRVAFAPIAGMLVDRYDRRALMIVSACCGALITIVLLALLAGGRLEPWHVYWAEFVGATVATVQEPAYTAARSQLVPSRLMARANGMVSFASATSQIVAPLAAGVMLLTIGLEGLLLVDVIGYGIALAALVLVRFPPVPRMGSDGSATASLWREIAAGWSFIAGNRSLLAQLKFIIAVNFGIGFAWVLFTPLVLGFASTVALGWVTSAMASGLLAGSTLMSFWDGPRRRVDGLLGAGLLMGICLTLMGIRPSVILVGGALFGLALAVPIFNANFWAMWQVRIPLELQGRAFAAVRAIAKSLEVVAYVSAGPLVDHVFGPLLLPGGSLAATAGLVVGTGTGRGTGLLLMIAGVYVLAVVTAASRSSQLRSVEEAVAPFTGSGGDPLSHPSEDGAPPSRLRSAVGARAV